MVKSLQERINDAALGRKFWLHLVEKYKINLSVYVIVLPEEDQYYNGVVLSNLPQYMEKRGIKEAIILSFSKWLPYQLKQKNIRIVNYKKEDIDKLIQFYCLYEFAPNIVIASLEKPSGRMGKGMIDRKGLTGEEIFVGIVFSLVE